MNRNDLRLLAGIRLKEAQALLARKHYDGAYYLTGYAVECALKSRIAKQTKRYDFPDMRIVKDSYTHNLNQLVTVAGLRADLELEMRRDAQFEVNWAIVKDWTEQSRYKRHNAAAAQGLYAAAADDRHGVLRWLRQHW